MGRFLNNRGKAKFFFSKDKRILAAIDEAKPWRSQSDAERAERTARVARILDQHPAAIRLINVEEDFRRHALEYGGPEYGCLLLDRGLDINRLDEWGRPSLQIAVEGANIAVVKKLLDLGADATVPGPLHMIATWAPQADGDEALIRLLVSRGADVNAAESMRSRKYVGIKYDANIGPEPATPLDIAKWQTRKTICAGFEAQYSRIVRVLLDLGARNSPGFDAAAKSFDKARDEKIAREQCQYGSHQWVAEGIWFYYKRGIPYKSEVSRYVCKWCGKPKPR